MAKKTKKTRKSGEKKYKNANKSSKKAIKSSKSKAKKIPFEIYDKGDNGDIEEYTGDNGEEDVDRGNSNIAQNISHNDIDSEIEDLRRRVFEEEEDAKFVKDDSKQSKVNKSVNDGNKFGIGAALFELIPGLLLSTLGIGHLHNRRIAKGFLIMICYWVFLAVELYVLFNIFVVIELNDFIALAILFVIINLFIIFVSTHSVYHEN